MRGGGERKGDRERDKERERVGEGVKLFKMKLIYSFLWVAFQMY